MSAHTITIWNSKGGSTKTQTTLQLLVELAQRGKRVLGADFDYNNPGLTFDFWTAEERKRLTARRTTARFFMDWDAGIVELPRVADLSFTLADGDGSPLYDVKLLNEISPSRSWQPGVGRLELIPGSMRPLSRAIKTLEKKGDSNEMRRQDTEIVLRTALARAQAEFDFILLDTPPTLPEDSLGLLNELKASDAVIIPLPMEQVALEAALIDIESIQQLNTEYEENGESRRLQILGVVITRYHDGWRTHRQLRAQCEESPLLQSLLFQTVIPEDSAIVEAQSENVPVQLLAPASKVAEAVSRFTQEVLNRV